MKLKIFFATGLTVLLRIINILYIKTDPFFILSPRNFNGRGLLVMPSWLDFLIPISIILILYNKHFRFQFDFSKFQKVFLRSFIIFLTPVTIGFLLNNYVEKTLLNIEINSTVVLRYLLFLLTFAAANIVADRLTFIKKKRYRYLLFGLFLTALAITQDFFGGANAMTIMLGMLSSTGVITSFLVIALRKDYKSYPSETMVSVAATGIFFIFFYYNAISPSYFTILLPFLGLTAVSFALFIKDKHRKTKTVLISSVFILALFLNYLLPSFVSSEAKEQLMLKKSNKSVYEKQVGSVIIKYNDPATEEFAVKCAEVIDAANEICEREFGFSPGVKELVIKGFGGGGFHAEFPNRIVGNVISKQYIENCFDSSFLNNPGLSPNFPDPVNGLLHEYSHLFGVIPYHKWWPGAEEEGWATFSATVISGLLYREHKDLWQPAYNYAGQAEKITALNLSGKAVAWSHPNEFGGFYLWYHLAREKGLKKMYALRWNIALRNINGMMYMPSIPEKAKLAVAVFGKENFEKYGSLPPKPFGDIYSESDYIYLAETTGMDKKKLTGLYQSVKNIIVNPQIDLPQ